MGYCGRRRAASAGFAGWGRLEAAGRTEGTDVSGSGVSLRVWRGASRWSFGKVLGVFTLLARVHKCTFGKRSEGRFHTEARRNTEGEESGTFTWGRGNSGGAEGSESYPQMGLHRGTTQMGHFFDRRERKELIEGLSERGIAQWNADEQRGTVGER